MTTTIPIHANCRKCGARITWKDDSKDTDIVSCGKCGTVIGPYGEFRDAMLKEGKAKILKEIEKSFKSTTTKINIRL